MSNKIQRVDAGNLSSLVEALKKHMGGETTINSEASKLLGSNNDGLNGYSVHGTMQPTTMSGNNIRLKDLDAGSSK